jgi:hypothetical protein
VKDFAHHLVGMFRNPKDIIEIAQMLFSNLPSQSGVEDWLPRIKHAFPPFACDDLSTLVVPWPPKSFATIVVWLCLGAPVRIRESCRPADRQDYRLGPTYDGCLRGGVRRKLPFAMTVINGRLVRIHIDPSGKSWATATGTLR